jgi:hypothetical protein
MFNAALRPLRLAAAVALVAAGCRTVPPSYRLTRQGGVDILVPPRRVEASGRSEVEIRIRNARRTPESQIDCDVDLGLIAIHWQGARAKIVLRSESYFAEAGGSEHAEANRYMYLGTLRSIDAFRLGLLNSEAKGCIRSDEGERLRAVIAERLPLSPSVAYRLRFGAYDISGFFDLTSDFRLEIISPIYNGGDDSLVKNIAGFETSYYVLVPERNSARVLVSLASVTDAFRDNDVVERASPRETVTFPRSFAYLRLLFRSTALPADHQIITVATILSSTDEAILNEATERLKPEGEPLCQPATFSGITCMTFPPSYAVNPEMRVNVNGKEIFVPVGGTVGDAITAYGVAIDPPQGLRVRRLFNKHSIPVSFDSGTRDILELVLMPGDVILWH